MMDTMLSALRAGLPELGVTIPAGADETLCRFGCELIEQNKVMNLTAITEPRDVATLHFLDSAALLTLPLEQLPLPGQTYAIGMVGGLEAVQ